MCNRLLFNGNNKYKGTLKKPNGYNSLINNYFYLLEVNYYLNHHYLAMNDL